MQKLIATGLVVGLLTGCGFAESKNDTKDQPKQNQEAEISTQKTDKYPFSKVTASEVEVVVTTSAGNSYNGKVPAEFVTKDTKMAQIGVDLANFQEDKKTFIYVDKRFYSVEQGGELKETAVVLSEDTLKPGMHTVTAVQFEGDKPTGRVLDFSEAKVEIKERK